MYMNTFVEIFAVCSRFDDPETQRAAQLAFLARRTAEEIDLLAQHDNLHHDTVIALIKRRMPVRTAKVVAEKIATVEQLDLFLRTEKRDKVLSVVVPKLDDFHAMIALGNAGDLTRSAIVQSQHLSVAIRLAALRSGAVTAAAVAKAAGDITEQSTFSDDEVMTALSEANWAARGKTTQRVNLQRMFMLRPALMGYLTTDSPADLVTAAAGSVSGDESSNAVVANLVIDQAKNGNKWGLLAAIANPRHGTDMFNGLENVLDQETWFAVGEQIHYREGRPKVTGPFDEVDTNVLTWLKKRAFPSDLHSARPVEVFALASHPSIRSNSSELLQVLEQIADTYPVHQPEVDNIIHELNLCLTDLSTEERPEEDEDTTDMSRYNFPENNEADDSKVLSTRIDHVQHHTSIKLFRCAEAALGDQPQRWETLWALVDELDPTTTVGELFDLAGKL